MTFVQIIEYETNREDEVNSILDQWMAATEGKRTALHELHTQDRDKPGHCVDIVEFPSYAKAMENNDLPETRHVAEQLRALCTGEPRYLNLEVAREESLGV